MFVAVVVVVGFGTAAGLAGAGAVVVGAGAVVAAAVVVADDVVVVAFLFSASCRCCKNTN